jgi:hypothetical protein
VKEAKQRMLNDTDNNMLSVGDAKIRLDTYVKELHEEIKTIYPTLRDNN